MQLHRWNANIILTLSAATLIGLFAVNTVGFIDTETGSAFGCGTQWPLCDGAVIPTVWGLHTLIEFMHRALVGLVTVLLLTLAVWAWVVYRKWREVRVLILISVGFVFIQAGLGAIGVIFGDPPSFLATHFGVSLMAFSGVLLLFIVIRQIERKKRAADADIRLRGALPDPRFRFWTWVSLIYIYCAMYVGAYVSNTGVGERFRGWPIPIEAASTPHAGLAVDWLHRSIALGMILLTVRLLRLARPMRSERPDLYIGSLLAVIFVSGQALSGALLILTHVSLGAFLTHVTVISLLFGALCYLGLQTFPGQATAPLPMAKPVSAR